MKNRMCLTATALALSMAGFGPTGYDRETRGTAAKTETADRQAGGAQAAGTQANGSQTKGGQEGGSWMADGKRYRATLCPSGTADDMGWCQSACDSLKLLEADYGYEVTYTEDLTPDDIEAVFADYAASGYDVAIGHRYEFGDPVVDVTRQYPDTKLIVTEGEVPADNVASYVLKCEEGGYITGMLATGISESGRAGSIGPTQDASLVRTMNRSEDGAEGVNPDIWVQAIWIGPSTDAALGKKVIQAMIDNGADVIGHYTNESGTGAVNVAKEAKVYIIGDSYNQNDLVPDTVLSSSVHHIPHVVEVAPKMVADGTFKGGIDQLGMAGGAVSVTPYRNLGSAVPDELKQKISNKIAAVESETLEVTCDIKPRT